MLKVRSQQTYQRRINVEPKFIINVHQRCFNADIGLKTPTYIYRCCSNVKMRLSFFSIVSYQQNCFWCQPKFNVNSRLTLTLNQRWQYNVDTKLISHRPISRRYFDIYQRWNNVECLLGCDCINFVLTFSPTEDS